MSLSCHRALLAAPIVVALGAAAVPAQQPAAENPNALRPPTLLTYPPAGIRQEVVRLYYAELTRALQKGDTTTLAALVPDSVIPKAERAAGRTAGCSSVGNAMTRLRTNASTSTGRRPIALDQITVTPAGQGDTVA